MVVVEKTTGSLVEAIAPATLVPPKPGTAMASHDATTISVKTTMKERKIREHNTDMTETRAARVEQNTRHKAEPLLHLELTLVFPEEEGMMQQSSISISLSF